MTAPTKNKRDLFKEPGLYDSIRLPEASPERPYVAINMVMTADGAISPPDHSYRHISGPEDQRTYRRMRIHFDAIMRGTKTLDIDLDRNLMNAHIVNARAQIGLPNPPFVVILTNTGNVDPNSLIFQHDIYPTRPLLFVPEKVVTSSKLQDVACVIQMDGPQLISADVLQWLRENKGVERVLSEGGATLNYSLISENTVDEYFLTISPTIIGQSNPRTPVEGEFPFANDKTRNISLISSISSGDEVFLRYKFEFQ